MAILGCVQNSIRRVRADLHTGMIWRVGMSTGTINSNAPVVDTVYCTNDLGDGLFSTAESSKDGFVMNPKALNDRVNIIVAP